MSIASCKNNENNVVDQNVVQLDSIIDTDKKIIRAIGETLTPESKEKVEDWKEYQQLDDFLDNFYSSSPNEALNLSKELANTTKQLKDSIKIDRFKQADVSIRINVIHNYALRLADMATIPSIKVEEVQEETQNILDAFSALNSKINNLTKQEKLEEELKNFTAPIQIGGDQVIKPDSIPEQQPI
ncbi:hypothetical protein UMM65_06780 [Aureibaculum sp. 2210JD6-5]|uniref:hypothetical protein n=1 Tax=Aureibaculum sp. 2210JD6-5 TaxID=3103957 RepID=UPI002AACE499|nr:hypothetical protein [Aureibaculum sp. 2210JD6-5]MDY7394939.1 hypothetical protein [Aureibaculum sp. 2210JD6-5]